MACGCRAALVLPTLGPDVCRPQPHAGRATVDAPVGAGKHAARVEIARGDREGRIELRARGARGFCANDIGAAGGIQGLQPMRYEKRVARNRFMLLVAVLFLTMLGIILVFVRHR